MIVSQFGQEALDKILMVAGLEESEHFKMFYSYEDKVLEQLLGATSKCLGLPVEMVLEVFGDYFITFSLRHGYDDMLRTLGGDMTSFIQNLDSLHSLLALSYDKMVAPSFRCDTRDDGSLTLHYHSSRTGYYPLVVGLLSAVAREIFNQEISIAFVSSSKESVDKGRDQEHVIFHVTVTHKVTDDPVQEPKQADNNATIDVVPAVSLNKDQFATAFPYHLIFDDHLVLRQYGRSIARLSPVRLREGIAVTSAFRIMYPRISFTVENICRFINAIFILSVDPNGSDASSDTVFSMKGQMIWMNDTRLMIFIGSPRLTSLKEMKRMNIYMADIPLYDVTREMVLLYQQRSAEIDITKELDETTALLKRTSRDLELEKQRTERLLYQMLPEKVANQLKNGQEVEAEKFDRVTVLFSDIVNFTTIAAASSPLEVVKMLNDLYHRFDLQTNEYGVYKVETIGDAYMVVSGVPDITEKHAQRVANFALDMVNQAGHVLCPDTKKPLQVKRERMQEREKLDYFLDWSLRRNSGQSGHMPVTQIRVGLHTGPVVAGVVGVKMPRYCLFGDTVNTASRMESNSVPGRIHVSETTFGALKDQGYLCRCRGEVNIKGKGVMTTYFLIGSRNHAISEPDDEHTDLPLIIPDGDVDIDSNELSRRKYIRQNGYSQDHSDLETLRLSNSNNNNNNNDSKDSRPPPAINNTITDGVLRDPGGVPPNSSGDTLGQLSPDLTWYSHPQNTFSKDTSSKPVPRDAGGETNSAEEERFVTSGRAHPEETGANATDGAAGSARSSTCSVPSMDNQKRFQASIKDRRVNDYDVGRYPVSSKTCTLL